MKKKFSKIFGVGLTFALVASLLVIAAPVSASPGVSVTPAPGDGPLSGEVTFTIEYDGAGTPVALEVDVAPPDMYQHWEYVLGQGDPNELDPHPGLQFRLAANSTPCAGWGAAEIELAREIGFVGATYDVGDMEWTITIDTLKKCEVGDSILMGLYGWWPGQEVYFDGLYDFWFQVEFSDPNDDTEISLYYLFDNDECITPELGLNAKGAQQKFWLNYIDMVDAQTGTATGGTATTLVDSTQSWTADALIGMLVLIYDTSDPAGWLGHSVITGNTDTTLTFADVGTLVESGDIYYIWAAGAWTWVFDPGVNLTTWGDAISPADVKVLAGGRPYTDSYGACHPAFDTIDKGCMPDRFIEIQARAPLLGDCEIEVWTAVLGGNCCVDVIGKQVASAEKKWGELNFSKLDVHIEGVEYDPITGWPAWREVKAAVEADFGIGLPDPFIKWTEADDHEVYVSAGDCENPVYEKIAEWVWCDFLQLTNMYPAGGAVVHWWLAEDTEANQIWIQDLMDEIVGRAGDEGFRGHKPGTDSNDYWSATGEYDPQFFPKDVIMAWITDAAHAGADPQFAVFTDIVGFEPTCSQDPYVCKDPDPEHTGPIPFINVADGSWYGRSLTMDNHPGEIPGVTIADLKNIGAEDVLIITFVEYEQDYNGENLVLIQIGKKHFRTPPPPVQVKIPQVRWAGEKIVLEKDWGEDFIGNWVSFTIDQDSIGALVPVLDSDWGYGNHVDTCVMPDGVARVIFESEYEGQAEVKCVLYDCVYTYNSTGGVVEAQQVYAGPSGCLPRGNHDFPLFYLKLESIEPLNDSPEPVDPLDDALFGVQVKGWFWSKTTEKSGRPEKWVDVNPLQDSLPNVINGGNGIPDDDHDQYLPAGRWVLPDDWPTLAGVFELRRHWDLMNNWEDRNIWSTVDPWGPYNSAVVTTAFPGFAEFPTIGPFNTTQPVAIEDEVVKWVTTASVWADYMVAFPWLVPPAFADTLPLSLDWTLVDLRNTVVPDGKLEWFDCPMSPAKVIFQIAEDQVDPDLFNAWKFAIEPYSIYFDELVSGTATAAGTITNLVDATQAWTVDALIDETVYIWSAGALYRRVITDNTATGLTFDALPVAVGVGDTYYFMWGVWFAPYYHEEIPSSWFIPVGGMPEGYNWDSWGKWTLPAPGTTPAAPLDDGPYPFWLDLGLTTTVPATDDEVMEVYSDNNGIAYVGMSALGGPGTVDIHAKADYPYQRKHTPLVSIEVTQTWGAIELNPHFVADELVVEVDELVIFENLTAGGTLPYVRAAWDIDGDGIAEITYEDPAGIGVMDDALWAYDTPNPLGYSVILTMTDSTPTTRWEERPNYIIVSGEVGRKGDFNGDGHITLADFVSFAGCYGCVLGDVCYNVIGDFNDDGEIGLLDFVDFAAVYGT